MNKNTSEGFEKLHQYILASATATLETIAPEHVKAFRESLLQGKGPEHGLRILSAIQPDSQYRKYRRICLRLIDVQLQVHRVKNSLVLLNAPATLPISQGEWVEYHFDAWALLMQGLLYRVEKITKEIVRELIRPMNPNWKTIETKTLEKVADFKSRIATVRDPIAHSGGAVEALEQSGQLESYILIGGISDMRTLLEPIAAYQSKWYEMLSKISSQVFDEIDSLSEHLLKEIEQNL